MTKELYFHKSLSLFLKIEDWMLNLLYIIESQSKPKKLLTPRNAFRHAVLNWDGHRTPSWDWDFFTQYGYFENLMWGSYVVYFVLITSKYTLSLPKGHHRVTIYFNGQVWSWNYDISQVTGTIRALTFKIGFCLQ